MPNSNMVNSLLKALDILKAVSHSENGMRLNDLSDAFEMKKTTVHNLVRTMRARGFLIKDSVNRFKIGPAISEIMDSQHGREILIKASKTVKELSASYNDGTVTFSELNGSEIFCRLRMSPDRPGLLQKSAGQTYNPYTSATGICFQAMNQNYHSDLSSKNTFEEAGIHKWGSIRKFELELDDVRRKGYVFLKDEVTGGVRLAVSAGVYFVLGISFRRFPKSLIQELAERMLEAGKGISIGL